MAVAFNNAARQLSLAGATGFSGRKQLGPPDAAAPHLEKPGAQATGRGIENHRHNMTECRGPACGSIFIRSSRLLGVIPVGEG